MKNNKIKFGIVLISAIVLGAVAPALTDVPVLGATVVRADESQEPGMLKPLKYRIRYHIGGGQEIAPPKTGVINPGESINIYKDIDGYEIVTHPDWMPGYIMTHEIANTYFYGASDGYVEMYLKYKKKETPAPTPTPTPEPAPTPTPEPGQDQGQKPDQATGKQLPETGEESSTFTILLGLLTAGLAWLLRKKNC